MKWKSFPKLSNLLWLSLCPMFMDQSMKCPKFISRMRDVITTQHLSHFWNWSTCMWKFCKVWFSKSLFKLDPAFIVNVNVILSNELELNKRHLCYCLTFEKEEGTPTIWQYRLWSFQTRGMKLERFLPKNQHTQRKLLNFDIWELD